jgi:hypothetical protein
MTRPFFTKDSAARGRYTAWAEPASRQNGKGAYGAKLEKPKPVRRRRRKRGKA